jgi:glutathione S-transferase
MFIAIVAYAFDPNEESKAMKYSTLINETIPLFMNNFDSTVAENKGYFVNGKVTFKIISTYLFIYFLLHYLYYIYIYIYTYIIFTWFKNMEIFISAVLG